MAKGVECEDPPYTNSLLTIILNFLLLSGPVWNLFTAQIV